MTREAGWPWQPLEAKPRRFEPVPKARQVVRFYRGSDGAPWVEVVNEQDRTSIIQRPASNEDRERWAKEWAAFEVTR